MSAVRNVRRVLAETWLTTVYAVLGLPIGIITFVTVVVGLALTAGLAVTFIFSVPVLIGTLLAVRLYGRVERARAAALLGIKVADPHLPIVDGRWWQRWWRRCRTKAVWKEVAYCAVQMPVNVVTFTLLVGVWSISLVLLAMPFFVWALPDNEATLGPATAGSVPGTIPASLVGLMGLIGLPWVARAVRAVDGALVRGLLGAGHAADLEVQVERLTTTRARAVDVADDERRRIERDLHDGAQQRLVSLAMNLGRAKERFASDPDGARTLVDEAHVDAKAALVELRDLARGIRPAILSERGLDPALSSMAARSAVPVQVSVDLAERPPASIEGLTYFLVGEALTNVAKHSRARAAAITVRRHHDRLLVEVTDDGVGGADTAGHGLAGLADRVAAVDGWFHVLSPEGGPTTVMAELPCGS